MTKALAKEERIKIVNAYNEGDLTVEKIASIFQVTSRSVYNYVKQYKDTGDLSPGQHTGRPPTIDEKNKKIIEGIVRDNPDWTLEEYRDKFYQKTKIHVTIVTIHNTCKNLNLNRKKKVFLQQSKKEKM